MAFTGLLYIHRVLLSGVAFAGLAFASASPVEAQDTLLQELYGRGVHAYFSGEYAEAHGLFSETIKHGNRDPRAYFFRGFCFNKLGRDDEAAADFKQGAVLEVSNNERIYPISRSLARVQGSVRLTLERHRREARLSVRQRKVRVQQARYEQLREADKTVLRKPSASPTAVPPLPGDATKDAKPLPADTPPLPADAAKPAAPPMPKPTATKPNDPFANGNLGASDPKKSTEKPAAKPASKAPAAAKQAAPKAPSNSDPFADDAPAGKAPAAKPPAKKPAASDPFGDDPFGDSKKPAAVKPAAAKPAAAKPAPKKPAEKDPFADDPFADPDKK